MDCVLVLWRVGVYRPVGVDNATVISAFGRMVSVGFEESDDDGIEVEIDEGVMELRNTGHSIMAFERVLMRMGKYVRRVYC